MGFQAEPSGSAGLLAEVFAAKTNTQNTWTTDVAQTIDGWTDSIDTSSAFASNTFTSPTDGILDIDMNIHAGTPGDSNNVSLWLWACIGGVKVAGSVKRFACLNGYPDTKSYSYTLPVSAGNAVTFQAVWGAASNRLLGLYDPDTLTPQSTLSLKLRSI